MRCPYCNEEMEQGIIQSSQEIFWDKKKHFFARAEFHEGAILLSGLSMLKGSAVIAHCCRNCEKMIVDYTNNGCDINKPKKT